MLRLSLPANICGRSKGDLVQAFQANTGTFRASYDQELWFCACKTGYSVCPFISFNLTGRFNAAIVFVFWLPFLTASAQLKTIAL